MPSGPRESELKLLIAPDHLDMVGAAPLLRELALGKAVSQRLVGTYFDTSDHRLARRRIALRVRRVGRRRVQALKTGRTAGAIQSDRGEWQVEIEGDRPDLLAFGDPHLLELTGLILPEELLLVCTTRVHRRSFEIGWTSAAELASRVEVALDRGEIEAGGRQEPISELELELLDGSPEALFEIAAALRQLVPLRLGGSEKAARGFCLAKDRPPAASMAPPVALRRGQTVEDALAIILRGCIAHALADEAAAADGRDAEGVHQLRIALRRLRSALTLFRTAIPVGDRQRWQGEARWALGCLGPCRDLEVLQGELLPPLGAARPEDRALGVLAAVAREQRDRAQQEVRDRIAGQRWGDLLLELACWVEGAGWRRPGELALQECQRRPVQELATTDLGRGYRRVRRRGRRFARLDAEGRHGLRIALKKLRYGIEFFAALFPAKPVRRWLRATKALQDQLGRMNDIVAAERRVDEILAAMPGDDPRRIEAARGGGELVGWHARLAGELEPEARDLWRELRALEPFWR